MLQVLILLILFSDFYRFQAILTRDAIISSGKLYVFKCLMHLLTIVYVNIDICCKCWYCWFFFLTFPCSRPFRRGTLSSPVGNCMYLPFIYGIQLNAICINFYRVQAISTRDAIISSWKLYVFTFHLWYSIKCHMHRLLQGPGHFDEGRHHLQLETVRIYLSFMIFNWMPYASTFTGSRSFRRGTPSSPVENCMYLPSIYDIQLNA